MPVTIDVGGDACSVAPCPKVKYMNIQHYVNAHILLTVRLILRTDKPFMMVVSSLFVLTLSERDSDVRKKPYHNQFTYRCRVVQCNFDLHLN